MQEKVKIVVQLLVLLNSFDHYLNACLILMSPISSQEFHKVHTKTLVTAWKVLKVFPGPYFPVFGLNTDQKNSVFGHLSRSVCQSLFFNRVTDRRPEFLLKKKLHQRCFLVNFPKFSRAYFFIEHLRCGVLPIT